MNTSAQVKVFSSRIDIKGVLEVKTPLHLGSGLSEEDESIPKPKPDEKHPESARVMLDGAGRPYIPGSSVKGALRAMAADAGFCDADILALFGTTKDTDQGHMGRLIVYGGEWLKDGPPSDRPKHKDFSARRQSRALRARTSISARRGTAEKHLLYHTEVITPGTHFEIHARYLPEFSDPASESKARELLGWIVEALLRDGVQLGRGAGDGDGRLVATSLTSSVQLPPGKPDQKPERLSYRLMLKCDGPFFINDWSWDSAEEKKKLIKDKGEEVDKKEAEKLPQLKAQRTGDNVPLLEGSSLMGALRSRAEWLEKLQSMRDNTECRGFCDELFGSTEKRGLLRLASLDLGEPLGKPYVNRMHMTSLKIDRFSGAPIEGALFATDCFVDPEFEAVLELKPLGKVPGEIGGELRKFIDLLIQDMRKNGLRLGHGGNRGFGWFDVTCQQTNGS